MSRKRFFDDNLNYQGLTDISKWPTVLVDNLSEKNKEIFLNRKKAVDMYIEGKSMNEIMLNTNIHRVLVIRLVKRCLDVDEFGVPYGYKALIPYKRTKKASREFSKFLEKYPSLKEFIEKQYIGINTSKNEIIERNIDIKVLHKKFLKECHKLGIKENEYPFNTEDKCKRTLYRYTDSLINTYYGKVTKKYGDDAFQKLKSVGIGNQNNPLISRPFQQVQFDGHKIDLIVTIKFKTLEGDTIVKPISRIWLLVIIDVATRVILGYHICINKEYSSADVLKCIENAIKPKKKMNLSIPGLKYPDNGGFHSLCIKETEWAIWDEFLYDNAKANLAINVREKLTQVVKCSVNAGPVATPERRGIVERFFKTIENHYHRLPNTVGSHPKDPKRNNPEENAVKYEISASEIEELTEILIANYNNEPHEGINGFAPLDIMKQRIERGLVPTIMPYNERNDMSMLSLKVERVVRGKVKGGKRPFIYYEGVEYRNDVLARMPDLIGVKLTLVINIDDLRTIKAYYQDGTEFGLLTAKGKWSLKSHTLKERREINNLKRKKEIDIGMYDSPIDVYKDYLISKSINNKSIANKLASFERNQEQTSYPSNNDQRSSKVHVNKIKPSNDYNSTNKLTCSDKEKIEKIKQSKFFKTINT